MTSYQCPECEHVFANVEIPNSDTIICCSGGPTTGIVTQPEHKPTELRPYHDPSEVIQVPVLQATREQTEAVIVAWRKQRAKRLEENRIMEASKKVELALSSWLLEVFKQQKFEGMLIKGRITGLSESEVPIVEDKEAFMAHIKATGELELLQFRLGVGAVNERTEQGVKVPGIAFIKVHDLFDNKVK